MKIPIFRTKIPLRHFKTVSLSLVILILFSCSAQKRQNTPTTPDTRPAEHQLPKNNLPKNKKPDVTSPHEDKISPDYFSIALAGDWDDYWKNLTPFTPKPTRKIHSKQPKKMI